MSIETETEPAEEDFTITETGGLVASFQTAAEVKVAAKAVRDAGYRKFEVHSPHPIHGIDEILHAKRPPLPWGALLGAIVGISGGLGMAYWMNAVDYPFIISGKPMFSVLPSLPVAFELAILLAAFAVFGGTFALGGMPRLSNPLFRVPAFAGATNDRFFIVIDAADPKFDSAKTTGLLEELKCGGIDAIPVESPSESKLPRPFMMAAMVLGVLALVPPVMIAKARTTTSTTPRLSIISDMDYQPKFKAQTTNPLFADGRSMRPQVSGTIARGDLRADDAYYRGILPDDANKPADEVADNTTGNNVRLTSLSLDETKTDDAEDKAGAAPADGPTEDVPPMPNYVKEFPLAVDEALIRRGKQRYEIYCATCHGQGGDGDGLVTLRAMELEQGTWVKPTSLHAEPIRKQPVGQLYTTIANGVRKMPGYASQIPVEDRWAIVSYVKALQKTRTATSVDVPADVLPNMRELN